MGDIGAILLAAGSSRRMGSPKPLLPWLQGQTMISYQTRELHKAGYTPIVVVLGSRADQMRAAVPNLPGVRIVKNSNYRKGRVSSIIKGLGALQASMDGVVVLNVDSPRTSGMLGLLKDTFKATDPMLAVLTFDGRTGHPWLFSVALFQELLAITEEQEGLREVELRHREEWLTVETGSPLALTNINTRRDYLHALEIAKAFEDA